MESMQVEDHTDIMQIDQAGGGGVKSPLGGGLRRFFDLERRKAFRPIVFERELDLKKRPLSAADQPRERHRRRAEKFDIAFVEPKQKLMTRAELRTAIARRRAGNRKGFITGLDPFSDEEQVKKEKRAERFAASLALQDVSMHEKVDSYSMENAWQSTERERVGMSQTLQAATVDCGVDVLEARKDVRPGTKLRHEAIYIYGTDRMSTKDIMMYMKDFGPSFVEWINDSSCNIVFEDIYSSKRALIGMGIPEETMSEPIAGQEPLVRWYIGKPFCKGPLQIPLSMRIACVDDVKPTKGVISRHLWEARTLLRLPATQRRRGMTAAAVRRRGLFAVEPETGYEPSEHRLIPEATSGESVGGGIAGVTRDQHKRKHTRAADARQENTSAARRQPKPKVARPHKLQNSLYSIDINHIQNLTVNITNTRAVDEATRNGKRKSSGRRPGVDVGGGEQAPTVAMGGAGSAPFSVRDLRDWLNRGLFPEPDSEGDDEREADGYEEGSYNGEHQEDSEEREPSEERQRDKEDGTEVDLNDRWEDAEGGEVESGYGFEDRYVASDSGWEDEYLEEGTGEKNNSKQTMESAVKKDVKASKPSAEGKEGREERDDLQEKLRRREKIERREKDEWESRGVRERRDGRDGRGGRRDMRDPREGRDRRDVREIREVRDGRDGRQDGGGRTERERKEKREDKERAEVRGGREKRVRERDREWREVRESREKREREREWRDGRELNERLQNEDGERRHDAHKGEDRDIRRIVDEREARKRGKEKRRD